MERLRLVEPTIANEKALLTYHDEFGEQENGIAGTSRLAFVKNIPEWIDYLEEVKLNMQNSDNYVPARQYILMADQQEKVIGMLNLRLALNEYLFYYGGHIGYSIAPSERRKGYATKQLQLGLQKASTLGLQRVLITCDDWNRGSFRTIEKNHGQLEDKIETPDDNKLVRRYWINLV